MLDGVKHSFNCDSHYNRMHGYYLFESKIVNVFGEWTKLHNEEPHNLYLSLNILFLQRSGLLLFRIQYFYVMRACIIGYEVGNLHIMCNNIELQQTTIFEYLGTIIHQNGRIEEEVLSRGRKTNNIYYQLNQTIFGKKK
jgi:hypothetical protein